MPTPRTPFGVSVETPLPAAAPSVVDKPAAEPLQTVISSHLHNDSPSCSIIRLRYDGYTIEDIEKLLEVAHESDDSDDYARAEQGYIRLLDVSKHLLSTATTEYRNIVYEVACFFGRNDKMDMADQVLDEFSEECAKRWGVGHEQTLNHYATIGKLLAQWDRQKDAIGFLKRMTESFPSLATNAETQGRRYVPGPGGCHGYMEMGNGPLQDALDGVIDEHNEQNASVTLTLLQERFKFDCHLEEDGEIPPAQRLLDLLNQLEEDPQRNASDILRAYCSLVTYYTKAGMPWKCTEQVTAAEKRALAFCKIRAKLPTTFFKTAISLSGSMFNIERDTAADHLLYRLQDKFTDDYGHDHTDTISLLIRIGKMCQQLERWDLAQPRFEAAFSGAIDRFGLDGYTTKKLEACLEDRHYHFEADPHNDDVFFPIVTL